jgi:uncharacterized membrane protein YdjX (TVP38/TMEM64 family)
MGHHKKIQKVKILLIVALVALVYYLIAKSSLVSNFQNNPEILQQSITNLGIYGPLVIILLQTFQTIISIIPSQLTTIVAGFAYGPIYGLFYSMLGAFFGSSIIFFVAKKYGKEIVSKFFPKREIVHFNKLMSAKKGWALLFARLIPIFPNDLVSVAAGLTDIPYWRFTIFSTLGFVAQMALLTFFGSELSQGKISLTLIIIILVLIVFMIVVIFRNQLKRIFIKDLHLVEKKIEAEFKKI